MQRLPRKDGCKVASVSVLSLSLFLWSCQWRQLPALAEAFLPAALDAKTHRHRSTSSPQIRPDVGIVSYCRRKKNKNFDNLIVVRQPFFLESTLFRVCASCPSVISGQPMQAGYVCLGLTHIIFTILSKAQGRQDISTTDATRSDGRYAQEGLLRDIGTAR